MEILAHFLTDRLYDLEEKSGSVAKLSTIFVLPIVDCRTKELCDQVAVRRVQFNAV